MAATLSAPASPKPKAPRFPSDRELRRGRRLVGFTPRWHQYGAPVEASALFADRNRAPTCGNRNMINYQRRILTHIAVTRPRWSTA